MAIKRMPGGHGTVLLRFMRALSRAECDAFDAAIAAAGPGGCALAIETSSQAAAARLLDALGGPAHPAGALFAGAAGTGVAVVWDTARSPASLLLDLIEVETGGRRTIRPLRALGDDALAGFGGALLGIPDFTADRFIETHVEAALRC